MIPIGKTNTVEAGLELARVRSSTDPQMDIKLRAAAEKLEATFISEMLKHAQFAKSRDAFGGGSGEDQFSSYLRQAQANAIASSGGIGMAETLYEALKEKNDGSV